MMGEGSVSLGRDLILGATAGFGAGLVMDRVTTVLQERQSEASRKRERQVQDEAATTVLVVKAGQLVGRRVNTKQAERIGGFVHYGMGASTGVAAALLMRRGMPASGAGLASAMGTWLLVDEIANPVLGLTPAATEYPLVTHVRGFVGHVALGLALGSFLTVGQRLFGRPSMASRRTS